MNTVKITFECSIDKANTSEFHEILAKINSLTDGSSKKSSMIQTESAKENINQSIIQTESSKENVNQSIIQTESSKENVNQSIIQTESSNENVNQFEYSRDFDLVNTKYGNYLIPKINSLSADQYTKKKNHLHTICKNISSSIHSRGIIYENIPTDTDDLKICYIKYIECIIFVQGMKKNDKSMMHKYNSEPQNCIRVREFNMDWLKNLNFKMISEEMINNLEYKIDKLMTTKSKHFKTILKIFHDEISKLILTDKIYILNDNFVKFIEFIVEKSMIYENLEKIILSFEYFLIHESLTDIKKYAADIVKTIFFQTILKYDPLTLYNKIFINDQMELQVLNLDWLKILNFKTVSVEQINDLELKINELMITKLSHSKNAFKILFDEIANLVSNKELNFYNDKITQSIEYIIIQSTLHDNFETTFNFFDYIIRYDGPLTDIEKTRIKNLANNIINMILT